MVTARNLLASHFRGQSVQRRHQHRLVENTGATDPEQRTIDNEETAALASALTRLDPAERDLLMRHEVTGTDLATLAGEADVSSGAIAMRLARARANLRLEFLLVFRRMSLPSPQCRAVLLALAAGDRRRQAQLDAVGHVETCPTCATLLRPMTERDPRVAAWLVVPLGDLVRRIRRSWRSWWMRVATALTLLAVVGGLIVLVGVRGGADEPPSGVQNAPNSAAAAPGPTAATSAITAGTVAAAPPPAAVPTTALPATVAPIPSTPPGTAAVPPETVPPASVAAQGGAPSCPPPAPLTELELPAAIGCPFAVSVVTVVAVASGAELSATIGSWSVAVHLVGGGGLPLTVVPGVRISIAGTVEAAPSATELAVTVDPDAIGIAGR